jgi:inosine triphosphate pyrophosphatase
MYTVLAFATTNSNKLAEAQRILGLSVEGVKIDSAEIQSLDPIEVVTKKAQAAYVKLQRPILVEDTILVFNCLKQLPGTYIKDFLKTLGNSGLADLVSRFDDNSAYAQSTFVLCDGVQTQVFSGKIDGRIVAPRGELGFGWDPIFQPDGESRTYAEMSDQDKANYSMRAIGLHQLREWLVRQ